jgi:hypothetical protein
VALRRQAPVLRPQVLERPWLEPRPAVPEAQVRGPQVLEPRAPGPQVPEAQVRGPQAPVERELRVEKRATRSRPSLSKQSLALFPY